MNDEPVSYVTALDLADIMQDYAEAGFQYPLCMELKYVAVMLRQQQAEIEALKLRVGAVKLTNSQLVDLVQLHREEAEKMRNEILAWENAEVPAEVMAETIVELEKRGFITHPAKTLTDEEIDELVHEYNCIDDYPHEFVRACIRKAQEQ